jgi:hypothetical protein
MVPRSAYSPAGDRVEGWMHVNSPLTTYKLDRLDRACGSRDRYPYRDPGTHSFFKEVSLSIARSSLRALAHPQKLNCCGVGNLLSILCLASTHVRALDTHILHISVEDQTFQALVSCSDLMLRVLLPCLTSQARRKEESLSLRASPTRVFASNSSSCQAS